MRHSFRQAVQMQIQIADAQNGENQEDTDADHQIVGVSRTDDEAWQMMRCGGVKRLGHARLHSEPTSAAFREK